MIDHNYEHEDDTPGLARFLAGMLAGLLIGGLTSAGVVLLLAPQSGRRTRAKLDLQRADWCEQAADTVKDAVAQARVTARQVTHDVREQAAELGRGG